MLSGQEEVNSAFTGIDDFILFMIPISFKLERKAGTKNMAERNLLFNCTTHCLIIECLSACALKIITQK